MFKINWMHDWMNKDPEKRKKVTGLIITCGYSCRDSCWCDCFPKCKYRSRYKLHNLSVRVRTFFQYRLGIKLPYFLHLQRESRSLSGTEMCPYHKSRYYTCWDCEYCVGRGNCTNKQYRESTWKEAHDFDDPDWHHTGRCKFFEKHEYADNWDKKNGERKYD